MCQIRRAYCQRRGDPGQTMTEYALILATVAAVVVSLYTSAGTIVTTLVSRVGPLL